VSKFSKEKQKDKKEQGISSPQSPMKKRLYSISEAAIYLGRSVWGVCELIWNGKLPCVKVGRRIHLDIIDLDQWIEKNKIRNFFDLLNFFLIFYVANDNIYLWKAKN